MVSRSHSMLRRSGKDTLIHPNVRKVRQRGRANLRQRRGREMLSDMGGDSEVPEAASRPRLDADTKKALVFAGVAFVLQVLRPILHLHPSGPGHYISDWWISDRPGSPWRQHFYAAFLLLDSAMVLALGVVILFKKRRLVAGGIFLSLAILQALDVTAVLIGPHSNRVWVWFVMQMIASAALFAAAFFCLRGSVQADTHLVARSKAALGLASIALLFQVLRPFLPLWIGSSVSTYRSEWAYFLPQGPLSLVMWAFLLPITLILGIALLLRRRREVAGGVILALAVPQLLNVLAYAVLLVGWPGIRSGTWFGMQVIASALLFASAFFCLRRRPVEDEQPMVEATTQAA